MLYMKNYAKHHKPKLYEADRPGRSDKAERKYRRNNEHAGKAKTLRDKRS